MIAERQNTSINVNLLNNILILADVLNAVQSQQSTVVNIFDSYSDNLHLLIRYLPFFPITFLTVLHTGPWVKDYSTVSFIRNQMSKTIL